MKILIINGPNLNLLGEREPEVYGSESLDQLNQWLRNNPVAQGHKLKFYQSNHEGSIIDSLQANRRWADGMIINAGGLTHYSVALRDAITGCQVPTVEVHLSDIHKREEFRRVSLIEDACIMQISGRGKQGYVDAISELLKL